MELIQFFLSQCGCVRPGIVMQQNHVSERLVAPFVSVCSFYAIQELAIIGSIYRPTLMEEIHKQYSFLVKKSEDFPS